MKLGLRELLFLLVLLGLPVAAYFFVFQPINAEIANVRDANAAKQAKLERLKVAEHIENIGREIKKLDSAIAVFEAKLPAEKEVEVILKEVWQLATANDLRPRSVRTGDPKASTLYSEMPIRMNMIGDFDGFYEFLLDLEGLSRITRIHQMKLERLKDRPGHIEAEFVLSIFFEPQPRTPGGA